MMAIKYILTARHTRLSETYVGVRGKRFDQAIMAEGKVDGRASSPTGSSGDCRLLVLGLHLGEHLDAAPAHHTWVIW
jgi:hypothetical protein